MKKFISALCNLGTTDIDRAKKLEISPKTICRYRRGKLPKAILQLMKYPQLLEALTEDARQKEERRCK